MLGKRYICSRREQISGRCSEKDVAQPELSQRREGNVHPVGCGEDPDRLTGPPGFDELERGHAFSPVPRVTVAQSKEKFAERGFASKGNDAPSQLKPLAICMHDQVFARWEPCSLRPKRGTNDPESDPKV